jgi:hypothetical protein
MPAEPEHWKDQPDGHDFPAVADYLQLVLPPTVVEGLVGALRTADTVWAVAGAQAWSGFVRCELIHRDVANRVVSNRLVDLV